MNFFFVTRLKAQWTSGGLKGKVNDVKNLPIPDVTVVATHLPTGTKYSTLTEGDGRYALYNIKVGGPYMIEISSIGNEKRKREDIEGLPYSDLWLPLGLCSYS